MSGMSQTTQVLLGIEIGGTKLQMVMGEPRGHIIDRARFVVDRSSGAAGIREHIQLQILDWRKHYSITSVGVGFGGPINYKTGVVACSHHIHGWSGFELGPWLKDLTAAQVRVDNDANVAALGEALCGAGKGFSRLFYVTMGSGVGGGLIMDGSIYHGAVPGECEIGHIRLDRSGTIVESICSGWSVDKRIRELPPSEQSGALCRLTRGMNGGEAKMLNQAMAENDPAASRILQETAEAMAFALSHASQLMHPEIILLGGGLSEIGEPLRASIATALPRFIMEIHQPGPKVCLAQLREDAVPIGALTLAARAS